MDGCRCWCGPPSLGGGRGRAEIDGISIRNDEENGKEQVEGGGLDSGVGNEIGVMEVEQDEMVDQLRGSGEEAYVESTPGPQEESTVAP